MRTRIIGARIWQSWTLSCLILAHFIFDKFQACSLVGNVTQRETSRQNRSFRDFHTTNLLNIYRDGGNGRTEERRWCNLLFMNSLLPSFLFVTRENSVIVANNSDDYYSSLRWIIVCCGHDGRDSVHEGAILMLKRFHQALESLRRPSHVSERLQNRLESLDQHQSHVEFLIVCHWSWKKSKLIHSRRNNFQLFMLIFHFKSLLSSQITTTLGTTKNEWRIPKRWKTMDDDLYTSQTGRIGIDWSYLRLYLMSYVNSKRLSTYIIDFIRYDTVHCVCLSFFSFPSRTRLMADHIPCLAWN